MALSLSTLAYRHQLSRRLSASAVRIANYEHRLLAEAATMRPISLERLLDHYRAELIRYHQLEQELTAIQEPAKATQQPRFRKSHREKIEY